ncbi:hypothetical protein [Arenibaculum pallidiluteum]|uniref:hypothetical protein n=1 Tax=Arenibaculum pallidiluteum TaxID=2812559 RepID=UPI001A95EF5B|nr:hypothetical protein [Arenibaculum pallidiluteum]
MARGGFRPGAGRPKGAKKATPAVKKAEAVLDQAAAAAPEAPAPKRRFATALDFAMAAINGELPDIESADRTRLAIAAMPYQHPKLAEQAPGKKAEKEKAAEQAGKGRFAAPAGPRLVASNG